MLTNGMSRAIAVVLGLTLAMAALVSVSAQDGPPHYYYGTDATAGDTIGLHADGEMVDSTTVSDDGTWYIQARVDPDDASFSVNGEAATADKMADGEGTTLVSNLAVVVVEEEDSMGEDSMGEDSMGEDSMGEDSMGEDSMGEDSMGEDAMGDGEEQTVDEDATGDDATGDDEELSLDEDNVGFPDTGSGGLAGNGGVSAGLIGLLIALAAVSVTGLGLRRMRNRA